MRRIADRGAPCRISLTDATPGDEVILVNYEHHKVDSPYRMRFAIYVRQGEKTYDKVDEVPQQLRTRQLAARAFDQDGMMVAFELVEGTKLEGAIERLFAAAARRLPASALRGARLLCGAGGTRLTKSTTPSGARRRRTLYCPNDSRDSFRPPRRRARAQAPERRARCDRGRADRLRRGLARAGHHLHLRTARP